MLTDPLQKSDCTTPMIAQVTLAHVVQALSEGVYICQLTTVFTQGSTAACINAYWVTLGTWLT